MVQAGQMPGAGYYECDLCGEIVRLTRETEILDPCPYCKTNEYLELELSEEVRKIYRIN